jgi:HK97 family phage major capsid protein
LSDLIAKVNATLERRTAKLEERQRVIADASLTDAEKRSRVEAIDRDADTLAREAEGYVREAEVQSINHRAAVLAGTRADRNDGMEWRAALPSRSEARNAMAEGVDADGGFTVPVGVRNKHIELLRTRSVLLRIPGLNVVPFTTDKFRLPQLTATGGVAGPTSEGASITEGDTTWAGPELDAFAYKTIHRASVEILEDSALELRNILAVEMARDLGQRIDIDAFGSATSGRIKGLTATGQNTKTTLSTGNTVVKWDHVVGAVSDIDANGGQATAIVAHGAMAKALRLERENGATGQYMAGPVADSPLAQAQGLPILASNNLPVRSVLVVDGTRIFFGTRSTRLQVSDSAYFQTDEVGFKLVHRVAGLVVGSAADVLWIEASAT